MSGRRGPRPPWWVGVAAVPAVALVVLPLVGLLGRAAWSSFLADLTSPAARSALRLSLLASLGATAVTILLGLPLAWVLARVPFPGRAVVRGLVLVPLVLPPVVGGVALLAAFSRRGILGGPLHDAFGLQLTFSPLGVVLAGTFVALPFFVLSAEAGFRSLDRQLEEAGATLGSAPTAVFRRVTAPQVLPALGAGAVLAWARALGEFGATITFAGNVEGRTRTVPLAVSLLLEGDPDTAVALSLLMVAVSLAVIVGLRGRWLRRPGT